MNDSPYGPWQNTDLSPSKMKIYNDCTQKFKYRYVDKIRGPTGGAALQGSSLHEIFLEEFLVGGIQDVDALLDMMEMDLKHRLDTQDPRDYKTGLPLTEGEKAEFILQLRIWGKSLLYAMMKGEDHYGNKLDLPNVTETEVEGCVEVYLPRADTTVRRRGYIDLVFEDGSIGTVHYFANGPKSFPKERLEVFVDGKTLQLDNFRKLSGFGWAGFKKMNLWKQDKGQKKCCEAFVKAVANNEDSPIPINEIIEVSRVSIEVAQSS